MFRLIFNIAAAALLLAVGGCSGGDDVGLLVGDVEFPENRVENLAEEEQEELADLAGLGIAVADDEVDRLVDPLRSRDERLSALRSLPYVLGARRLGLGEAALRAEYEQSPEREITVRHLVRLVPRWATPAEREDARAVAEEASQRAAAGEDFARLAAELSEEPGAAERGGLLQPGRQGSWVAPFWEAAAALEVGEVSDVVETEYGYHVLRLEGQRAIPFEDAPRLPLLERLVPRQTAMLAMEEWAATRPPVVLDEPAVRAARGELAEGEIPESGLLAEPSYGSEYTGLELAAAWIALPEPERQALRGGSDAEFIAWAHEEARQSVWAAAALQEGAEPVHRGSGEDGWAARLRSAAAAAGFRPELSRAEIAAAALAAVRARDQEARIARAEATAFRPLLRRLYPVTGLVVAASSSSASNSEMRKSENTL